MPHIEDGALTDLQKNTLMVIRHARRLEEWIELERHLQQVVHSFAQLHREVKFSLGESPQPNLENFDEKWARFKELWDSFIYPPFQELDEVAIPSLQYIIESEPGTPDPAHEQLLAWLQKLVGLKEQIQKNLNDVEVDALRQSCKQVERCLQGRTLQHRNQIKREIEVLRVQTIHLRAKLDQMDSSLHDPP